MIFYKRKLSLTITFIIYFFLVVKGVDALPKCAGRVGELFLAKRRV